MQDVNISLGNLVYNYKDFIKIIATEKKADTDKMTDTEKKEYMKMSKDCIFAMHMLMGADQHTRFGIAIKELNQNYLFNKTNNYLQTPQACYTLLNNWVCSCEYRQQTLHNAVGYAFNIIGEEEEETDGTVLTTQGEKYTGPACEYCECKNHRTSQCKAHYHESGTMLFIEGNDKMWCHEAAVFNMIGFEDHCKQEGTVLLNTTTNS